MQVTCTLCKGSGFLEMSPEQELASRLISAAAQDWDTTVAEIVGPKRTRHLVEARRHVAQQLRKQGMGVKQIGFYLGRRDHSTVINLLNGR